MRQKALLSFVLVFVWLVPAMAQTREITGKVTDDAAKELPGVSIVIKGTQRGTVTDANGVYKLAIPDQGHFFNWFQRSRRQANHPGFRCIAGKYCRRFGDAQQWRTGNRV